MAVLTSCPKRDNGIVRLFVTGIGGYLGHALVSAASGWEVAGTVRDRPAPVGVEAHAIDVRDSAAITDVLWRVQPDAVIHTAFVQDGDELDSVNVDGSAVIARASRAVGARLIHVSSDAVFSHTPRRAVCERDHVSPVTPYGISKAKAEVAVATADPEGLIVRTSLIYGGQRLSKHERRALDPACAFDAHEIRCPILASDLADSLLELARMPGLSGVLHVAGADAINRLEFARLIVAAYGRDPSTVRAADNPNARADEVTLDCTRASALLRTRLRGVRECLAPGAMTH
ncbi:MAG: SDR family oxidoreductase [Solirubrobacteraceae bacterium]